MVTGILFGLGAALLQAVSYLCSAIFISTHKTSAATHLILVHIVMGIFSALLLPLFWHPLALDIDAYWLPLVSAAGSYFFGQFSLYQAIRYSVASRVSPLLGLKIFILAVFTSIVFDEQYRLLQWTAVGLCIVGAVWLSASGGRIGWRAFLWVVAACCGYAVSDISIVFLIEHFADLPDIPAILLSVTLCYLLCGLGSLALISRIQQPELLRASLPAAVSWFLAMCCLFACFAEIGVVFGGIVQSSRGLISILLTLLLAGFHWRFADPLPPRAVLVQRLAAAMLITSAIGLFSLGGV
ncbi:MAG TPA: hypothetical protein DD979_14485 [Gammaproteobacteria bacterium]|jgi:drug/metabolite transporter (DMT)-like permease|nr:hypothetical protein [Gammaproteobacteria bacterium]